MTFILIFVSLIFVYSVPVLAAESGLSVPTSAVSAFSITSVGEFIGATLSLVYLVAGVGFALFFLYSGISMATSGGDKGKYQSAAGHMTAAFVGLGIIAVAWAITLLAQTFFGINITSISLPRPY